VAVELAAEVDTGVDAPKRDPEVVSRTLEHWSHNFSEMPMLMGVEVRGVASNERAKALELSFQLFRGVPFQSAPRAGGALSR
jgi:hypothetical protein